MTRGPASARALTRVSSCLQSLPKRSCGTRRSVLIPVRPDLSRHSGVRPSSLVPRAMSRGELQRSGGGIDSAEVALEYIGFISMLTKRVDEAKRRP